MMPSSLVPDRFRRWCVRWLQAVALAHLIGGLVLTWAGHAPWFDGYFASIEQVFWSQAAPAAARQQQVWWMALFAATVQSYALYMLALIQVGDRFADHRVWGWLMAGLLLWAPQDLWFSLRVGLWSHGVIDALALLALLPPLAWLYRHDRRRAVPVGSRTQGVPR